MFVEQEARGGTTGKIFAGKSDVTNPDRIENVVYFEFD